MNRYNTLVIKLISRIIIMKRHIIIDIFCIVLLSYFIIECFNKILIKESFVNTSTISKSLNKVKRKGRARIYNIKSKVERNVGDRIRDTYKVSKTVMKKILFPKEIKITF